MMTETEHITVQVHSCTDHILLTCLLRISHEHKAVVTIDKTDHNRVVIAVLGDSGRCHDRETAGPKFISITDSRIFDSDRIRCRRIHKRIKKVRCVHIVGTQNMIHLKIIKAFDKSSQMILIIVRGDHVIDRLYFLIFKILNHLICMRTVSTIIEKIFSARLHEDCQSLPYINKVHRHVAACCFHRNDTARKQKRKRQKQRK